MINKIQIPITKVNKNKINSKTQEQEWKETKNQMTSTNKKR